MTTHSPLSPSGWERWSNCPGSVAFLADIPEPPSSPAALEGTDAHTLLEHCIGATPNEFKRAMDYVLDLGKTFPSDMVPAVQEALDYILERMTPGCKIVAERKVSLDVVSPGESGTCDVQILHKDGTLDVLDYKHGVGVTVSGERNGQALLYAVGGWAYWQKQGVTIKRVRTHIIQPRSRDGVKFKPAEFSMLELFDFVVEASRAAKRTKEKDAPLNPGPWCDKTFCKAGRLGRCPALTAYKNKKTLDEFGEPIKVDELDSEALAEAYLSLPLLRTWIKGVETRALLEANAGRMPKGLKFIEGGLAPRTWIDASDETVGVLSKLSNLEFAPRTLVSVPQAEKIAGKGFINSEAVKALYHRPRYKPKLVSIDDERPAITPSSNDFDPIDIGDDE